MLLDDSSNVSVPTERMSFAIDCLGSEENSGNKIEENRHEHHDEYWLEMFRRAHKECDQRTQRWLQQKFSAILINWIHNHPQGELAYRLHTKEYYIIETFRCFWNTSLKQQKFGLTSMSDVLSYLYVSMNTVILDTFRSFSCPQDTPLMSTGMVGKVQSNANEHSQDIWALIASKLANERERRIAFLLFQCALKPGEIVATFPYEFSDVNEISLLRRNIMELLSHGDQIDFALNKIS
jgi:hypothetical protein